MTLEEKHRLWTQMRAQLDNEVDDAPQSRPGLMPMSCGELALLMKHRDYRSNHFEYWRICPFWMSGRGCLAVSGRSHAARCGNIHPLYAFRPDRTTVDLLHLNLCRQWEQDKTCSSAQRYRTCGRWHCEYPEAMKWLGRECRERICKAIYEETCTGDWPFDVDIDPDISQPQGRPRTPIGAREMLDSIAFTSDKPPILEKDLHRAATHNIRPPHQLR